MYLVSKWLWLSMNFLQLPESKIYTYYVCYWVTTEIPSVDQFHRQRCEADPSMRLINPKSFCSHSEKLVSFFCFPKDYQVRHLFTKVMIYSNLGKCDLTTRPILCNQTLDNYHSHVSNYLWKSSLHLCSRTISFVCFSL